MRSIENEVELRGLRALVAVADFGSFRAAAVELGYTQSAISHQVAELSVPLGRRCSRGRADAGRCR